MQQKTAREGVQKRAVDDVVGALVVHNRARVFAFEPDVH
jgi:hypothetical protein